MIINNLSQIYFINYVRRTFLLSNKYVLSKGSARKQGQLTILFYEPSAMHPEMTNLVRIANF